MYVKKGAYNLDLHIGEKDTKLLLLVLKVAVYPFHRCENEYCM